MRVGGCVCGSAFCEFCGYAPYNVFRQPVQTTTNIIINQGNPMTPDSREGAKMELLPVLEPCPFCKCSVEMMTDADDEGYEYGGAWESISVTGDHKGDCPFAQLAECGTDYDGRKFTPEQVANSWNRYTHPPSPVPASVIEQCAAALDRVREDINWMGNNKKTLNGFVFDYLDKALTALQPYIGEAK